MMFLFPCGFKNEGIGTLQHESGDPHIEDTLLYADYKKFESLVL
jgi:hypothetical protein